jgi:hypothetical protein
MAKSTIPRGETSVIRHVFIMDSASTTGGGKTGLAYNTAGLSAYYIYAGGTKTALTLEDITTLGTYAAPTSAAHMRFKLIDDTNMPGWYEVQFHNDWYSVASARKTACVQMKGASGMAPLNMEFDVVGMELQSAAPKVDVDTIKTQAVTCAAGVTVLASVGAPAAPGASGGLPTTNGTKLNQTVDLTAGQSIACSDKTGFSLASTGADLILKSSTFVQAIVAAINELATYGLTALNTLLVTTGIKTASLANNAITAAAIQDDAITAAKINTGAITADAFAANAIEAAAIKDDAITAAKIATDAIAADAFAQTAADKVWGTAARVLTAATNLSIPSAADIADAVWDEASTGHTDAGKAGQQLWTDVDAILADTNELQVDDTPTAVAAVKTVVDAVKAKTDSLTFTVGNQVDANIQYINDTAVTGDGDATPWGPV